MTEAIDSGLLSNAEYRASLSEEDQTALDRTVAALVQRKQTPLGPGPTAARGPVPDLPRWMQIYRTIPVVRAIPLLYRGQTINEWVMYHELETAHAAGRSFGVLNQIRIDHGWRPSQSNSNRALRLSAFVDVTPFIAECGSLWGRGVLTWQRLRLAWYEGQAAASGGSGRPARPHTRRGAPPDQHSRSARSERRTGSRRPSDDAV